MDKKLRDGRTVEEDYVECVEESSDDEEGHHQNRFVYLCVHVEVE